MICDALYMTPIPHPLLRCLLYRERLAAVVGRRFMSLRQVTNDRGSRSIIGHHRTVNWAENEYRGFYNYVYENESQVSRGCRVTDEETWKDNDLYYDYTGMSSKNIHQEMLQKARKEVRITRLNLPPTGGWVEI